MSGTLFSLRELSLPARGGRESSDGDSAPSASHKKHNQGIDIPRSPGMRLNSITLQIPSGATAIVGLSGAGKTSLINVLAGFETEYSGELKSHISREHAKRLPLFWVPQSGGLWPHLSAEQHLEVVKNQQSRSESERFSKRTDELLNQFDLNLRRQALPAELSQGERSRLALARALATRACVLLLDEPLSHVDPVRKPSYWKIVRQIVAEENVSMVFTSHEPEAVLRHAEHVICLDAGSVAFVGSVRGLYETPPNRQVGEFLGPLNWFSADEARMFLDGRAEGGVRPERLQLRVADSSSLQFVSIPFVGAYCESTVRHVESGTTKSVMHQMPDVMPSVGDRVMLRQSGAAV